jgi:hypothetical protein
MCAFFIAFISYSFGKTIRLHEDKLSDLSGDIERHEREITRLDDTLMKHMNESTNSKKASLSHIKKMFTT